MARPATRDEPSVVVATRLEPETAKKLREAAERSESTPSAIARDILERGLSDD